jgi:hypothetical protein
MPKDNHHQKSGIAANRCLFCGGVIVGRNANAKYCSTTHSEQASRKRKMYVGTEVTHGRAEKLTTLRREALPLYHHVAGGTATLEQTAMATGVSVALISKDYREWRKAVDEFQKLGDWEQSDATKWDLGLDLPKPELTNALACGEWAVEMTDRFIKFEERWFRLAEKALFLRDDFHYEWITSILASIASGGYLQILSPPRHGKSELLVHFCVWLICQNPNIRILWVGPNEPIATSMLVAVKTYLEDQIDMIEAVLGPARNFRPLSAGGRDWSSTSFTVASRTVTLVGSTMLAVGRNAQILSRNADLIVCDDIENKSSTAQPKLRQETKDWFGTDLDSRKEEHTALIVIGSRQHLDDLYSANLEDDNFFNIVNSAHDPDCKFDVYDESLHVECMLFPELRTYRWLATKKRGAEARGNAKLFEMVYQNDPQGEGISVFDRDALMGSRNPSRGVGLKGIPSGYSLIAGLDPSSTGYQAGFLWGLRMRKTYVGEREELIQLQRWMVDSDNTLGGGIGKALDLMKRWLKMYGLRHWVVEINGFQKAIVDDPEIQAWAKREGVKIVPHETGLNKLDPTYGTGAMDRLFRANLIDLPYADTESIEKVDAYIKQALNFTDQGQQHRKNLTDILMASWLPTKEIRKMERRLQQEHRTPRSKKRDGYQKSYKKVGRMTGHYAPRRSS